MSVKRTISRRQRHDEAKNLPGFRDSADAIKNIVLVHGAWVDASGWKAVSDILSKDFKVTMVQEPETSFADDVAAAKAAIADAARSVQK